MNKKLLKLIMSVSMLSLVVAACGKTNVSSDSSASNNTSTSETTSSNGSTNPSESNVSTPSSSTSQGDNTSTPSSDVAATEYSITILQTNNATVTADKTKAKKGEIVTLTIEIDKGYAVKSVTVNGTSISADGGKYVFAMPNTDAYVQVVTELIDKDGVVLAGDISVQLEEGADGIYVARDVVVNQRSNVYFTVNGSDPKSCLEINRQKSFATLDIGSGKGGFVIDGNAKYDLYYDPSDSATPFYIIRTEILNLPTNEDMFASLFDVGSIAGESTLNPTNLNKIEYTSDTNKEYLTWELYENGSLTTVRNNATTSNVKSLIYKARDLDTNVYTVVDSYGGGKTRATHCLKDHFDNAQISGKYDIVSSNSGRYSITEREADLDINYTYPHNMEDLDMEMYSAYRNSYVGNIYNDVNVEHGATVTSIVIDETTKDFKTTLLTWVRWQNSAVYAESDIGEATAYIEFAMDVTFDKAGKLKEGSYTETVYDESSYDFVTNKKTDDSIEPLSATTFKYSYGDKKPGRPTYDVSKYFVSKITNVTVQSTSTDDDGNTLPEGTVSRGEAIEAKFDVEPATALDKWQYSIDHTDNVTIIGPRGSSWPYDFQSFTSGEVTLTISNHTKNANSVTADKKVIVTDQGYIRSVYMYFGYNYPRPAGTKDDDWGASTANFVAGRKYEVQMSAVTTNSKDIFNGFDLTFTMNPSDLISLEFNRDTGKLIIDASDATKITTRTSIKVTIDSPQKSAKDWRDSTLIFNVSPAEEIVETVVGTWNETEGGTSAITFTDDKNGVIHYLDNNTSKDISFTYTYDNYTGVFDVSFTSTNGESFTGDMYIDPADDKLYIFLEGEQGQSGTEYFGWRDEEGYIDYYVAFEYSK